METAKDVSASFRVYYKSCMTTYANRKKEVETRIAELETQLDELRDSIIQSYNEDKDLYKCDIYSFKEFVENRYIDGKFLRTAKGIFANKDENYELVGSAFDLFTLAKLQKEYKDCNTELQLYDKVLNLKLKDYLNLLRTFYFKVHEKIILEGAGYTLEHGLGTIIINRAKNENKAKVVDYWESRKRKAELLANGVQIANDAEKEWCKAHGVEYTGVDYKVYRCDDYIYEMVLLYPVSEDKNYIQFVPANQVGRTVRHLDDDGIIELCNGDIKKICQLDLGIKHKLRICLKVDKTLYSKYIRNENQKSLKITKADRKNRQRL